MKPVRALPSIHSLGSLRGKRVLLRVDFNVPIREGHVEDDFRIKRALPTIEHLRKEKARVILLSHRTDGGTLRPVAQYLNKFFPTGFAPTSPVSMREGSVVLLENLRHDPGEKKNSPAYAKTLAALGEVYVNDAFSVSHRVHASLVRLPHLLPHAAGFLFTQEVHHLGKAFDPPHPSVLILGGAKMKDKLPLVRRLLRHTDAVYLVGEPVKKSALGALVRSPKVHLPLDQVTRDGVMVDVGPKSVQAISSAVRTARFVLWNGPAGICEQGFRKGTEEIARALVASRGETVIGGGDTVDVVDDLGVMDRLTWVSTGGGAMLEFLATGTLPGIEALLKK